MDAFNKLPFPQKVAVLVAALAAIAGLFYYAMITPVEEAIVEAQTKEKNLKTELEKLQEVFTGNSTAARRFCDVCTEWTFQDPVNLTHLLLFTKLATIIRDLWRAARIALPTWSIVAALDGALLRIAASPLDVELLASPSTLSATGIPADRIFRFRHKSLPPPSLPGSGSLRVHRQTRRRLGGRHPL
jgi:hypothetical protein